MREILKNDNIIKHFVDRYEIPPITFENTIAEKLGEPKRRPDYITSSGGMGLNFKQSIVSQLLGGMRQVREERLAQTKPKSPSEIRTDAPPTGGAWKVE